MLVYRGVMCGRVGWTQNAGLSKQNWNLSLLDEGDEKIIITGAGRVPELKLRTKQMGRQTAGGSTTQQQGTKRLRT